MMTIRQEKVNKLIQIELADWLRQGIKNKPSVNLMVSVTKVLVSPDLSVAKVYLSIFPSSSAKEHVAFLSKNKNHLRHALSLSLKNKLRRMPQLFFFLDDTLDYIEQINGALKEK